MDTKTVPNDATVSCTHYTHARKLGLSPWAASSTLLVWSSSLLHGGNRSIPYPSPHVAYVHCLDTHASLGGNHNCHRQSAISMTSCGFLRMPHVTTYNLPYLVSWVLVANYLKEKVCSPDVQHSNFVIVARSSSVIGSLQSRSSPSHFTVSEQRVQGVCLHVCYWVYLSEWKTA